MYTKYTYLILRYFSLVLQEFKRRFEGNFLQKLIINPVVSVPDFLLLP